MFVHKTVELEPINNHDTPVGRFYSTPIGFLPSVTTVIGWNKGDDWLKDWENRVGADAAKKIRTRAGLRGTAVHAIAEKFLLNDPKWTLGAMPSDLYTFDPMKKILEENVGTIYGIEVPLWSSILRTAGRTDLWADWRGIPSIIDFKTSLRPKTEEQCLGYFTQETCYARMVRERSGMDIRQIVTLMMVDHDNPIVFVKRTDEYDDEVERVFISARNKDEPQLTAEA